MFAEHPESVLVVTPCSASKRHRVTDVASFEDLADADRRAVALDRLANLGLPAREMYVGQHHRAVLGAVDRLRRAWPTARIDVAIVSAGYGLIDEREFVVPYNATFAGLAMPVAMERARRLGIRSALKHRLADFEVGVFLLSERYLAVLEPPFEGAPQELYFAPPGRRLAGKGVLHIAAGSRESRALGVAPRMVKAALFQRFVVAALGRGWAEALQMAQEGEQLASRIERPMQLSLAAS